MGITPHIPTQNRTCAINAYGFSPYIPYTICKTNLPFIFVLETTDKIIAITNQAAFTFTLPLYDHIKTSYPVHNADGHLPVLDWLRSSAGATFAVQEFSVFHNSSLQKLLDYLKKSFVSYIMRQHLHQLSVVYMIKEPSDICFYHIIRLPILYHLYDFPYCLMAVPVWPEPKALIIKLRFINLLLWIVLKVSSLIYDARF